MHRIVLALAGIFLLGATAHAAEGLPEGTYASSKEGCAKLKTKTAAELGEDLDFTIVTKTGFSGYQQRCDFVNVTARNATSWIATAYCEEQGYGYPDLFAIAQKEGGNLSVTRLAAQEESYDGAADSEELADQDPSGADGDKNAAGGASDQSEDDLNTYVRCDSVKQ